MPWEWEKIMDFHWELSCGIINVLFLNSNRTSENALNSSVFTYCVQSVSGRIEKISQCSLHILCPQFPQMLSDLFCKRTYTKVFAILHPPSFLYFNFSGSSKNVNCNRVTAFIQIILMQISSDSIAGMISLSNNRYPQQPLLYLYQPGLLLLFLPMLPCFFFA